MKRLSTSLLIFILALLAVPDRAWAWTSVELRGTGPFDWTNGTQMTKINENSFTYEFAASEDFNFKFYVSDHNGFWLGYYDTSSQTVSNYDGNVTYWCNNIKNTENNITFKVDSRYKKYKIDLLWNKEEGGNHYFTYTVTGITEGGSSDPVSYALVGNFGSPIWEWNNSYVFKKTADNTYSLDIAGSTFSTKRFKFKYKEGSDEVWAFGPNSDLTIKIGEPVSFNGNSGKDYVFPTLENKDYVIELTTTAKTAGSFTVKEKTSAPETKYTVTISAGTGGSVNLSGAQQIGSTGVSVTATADEGYTFDKWTTTGGVSVASTSSATTTVTATADGKLTANFKATEPIDPQLGTSSNGKAYYLATEENGANSIFGTDATNTTTDNTVTYSRILRFNDKGDGSYELNIPATISGNVWILEIDKQNKETTYRPVETVAVGSSNPADKGSINGSFGGKSTVFTLTDRGDVDGIYKIKLNLNTSGIPAKWTITHDPLTRVAYYLSTASMSSASPVYDQRANTTEVFSNRFIGTNYFNEDSNVDYYVISNILKGNNDEYVNSAKKFDNSVAANSNWNVITTVNKLLLLGNGGLAFSDQKPNNEFSPNELPMKSSDLLKGLCAVEYNPSNGDHDKAVETTHYGIRGQIIVRQGSSSTETTSMTIVGPLVAASVGETGWNWKYINTDETLTYGISSNNVMKYDETENCYTITIVTNNEQQGKTFRFVRNGNSNYTWNEDETVARIPYYDNSVTGSSAATVADPNYVNYGGSATSRDIDILFNRPAGKWTIKFYIVNEASSSDGSVKSKYYYTINAEDNFEVVIPSALKKVLRTYSYGSDVKPQDANVHVYVAHSLGQATENDQYTKTKTGTVHLYEINYVPANTGVVLYCGEGTDAKTFTFVEANEYNVTDYAASKTDKKKLWKNSHEGAFNNDLEPVLARTYVENSVKDESGNIIARNFCMSLFSKTNTGKELTKKGTTYDDYIGFFRVKSDISANKAYLQYDKDIIDENAQIFGQDTFGEAVSGGAKLAMVFEGFEDDNVVTGISDNLSAKPVLTDDSYYNLQGMRVEKPVKGIYIHNGKKVVIK